MTPRELFYRFVPATIAGRRPAALGRLHVLLVEDDVDESERVRRLLTGQPDACFELAAARTLAEALACAQADPCDVILLDVSLPDSRGADGVQRLALALPRAPIVVLADLYDEPAALEALRHGAQDYLLKGAGDAAQLRRSIRYAVERKAFESILSERAHFDSLTGLVNRALFEDRLSHALAQAGRTRKRVALMFIDLDGFKKVNDTFGHQAGDGVLKAVARLLHGIARGSETVARLGGDEFTVILEQVGTARHAAAVAARILGALEAPIAVRAGEIRVTCSIGVALFPDTATDAESLLRQADTAMFHAKRSGRNNVRFFGETLPG